MSYFSEEEIQEIKERLGLENLCIDKADPEILSMKRRRMKLRNKKTTEIIITDGLTLPEPNQTKYNSLAELNAEWCDAPEEPKEYWFIDVGTYNVSNVDEDNEDLEADKEIGNYFETEEEAEKAVEKLKAWKRLKDKGLKLSRWKEAQLRPSMSCVTIIGNMKVDNEAKADLDLLFGGEK